ncbi:hypothetical protein BC827DRAFT_1384669 [Russula dissimulans]|nr:hypothetical protein BC827DRAFT_1384669 [Russula dissimulans]
MACPHAMATQQQERQPTRPPTWKRRAATTGKHFLRQSEFSTRNTSTNYLSVTTYESESDDSRDGAAVGTAVPVCTAVLGSSLSHAPGSAGAVLGTVVPVCTTVLSSSLSHASASKLKTGKSLRWAPNDALMRVNLAKANISRRQSECRTRSMGANVPLTTTYESKLDAECYRLPEKVSSGAHRIRPSEHGKLRISWRARRECLTNRVDEAFLSSSSAFFADRGIHRNNTNPDNPPDLSGHKWTNVKDTILVPDKGSSVNGDLSSLGPVPEILVEENPGEGTGKCVAGRTLVNCFKVRSNAFARSFASMILTII